MGLNSYYFTVTCYKRGAMQWIVEMEDLSRVAIFLIDSESYRTKKSAECEIRIEKDYVSCSNASVLLEKFKADNIDELRLLAMEG